jgi:hypothetical protein
MLSNPTYSLIAMDDDPYDLVLALFGIVIAAVMLVAGELWLVTRPDPTGMNVKHAPAVTSSAEQGRR